MRKKPESEQVGFLRGNVERYVRDIVEHEDDVRVECEIMPAREATPDREAMPARIMLSVFVVPSDMGLVLGNDGANANAIRRLVWTACKKTNYRIEIDFLTNGRR